IAAHSDQALAMLADPSAREVELLGAIPYQRNEAVLHTDSALLPRRRSARAAWNFHLLRDAQPQRGHRPREGDPHDPLRPPRVHARGRRRPGRAREHLGPALPHPLLRRLLGLGLSRGRGAERPARMRALRGDTVRSCLYEGSVRHRRRAQVDDEFHYPLFMAYLDLDELPELFDGRWLWSARRPAVARFRRSDYLGDPEIPLSEAVRALVRERAGVALDGPIRLLTCLRYFGHCFNPVSFYYCFEPSGEHVRAVVAEVTNTPWGERHSYVMPVGVTADRGSVALMEG